MALYPKAQAEMPNPKRKSGKMKKKLAKKSRTYKR